MCMSVVLLLSSCFVKEDRDECPCWMTVEMPDRVGQDGRSPVGAGDDGSVVLRLRGNSDEDAVDYAYKVSESIKADVGILEYEVPRGAVGVSAVAFGNKILGRAGYDEKAAGYDGGMPDRVWHDGDQIRIPVGEQMDSLYGFFKMYHTRCESVKCDIELHKEFCTVSFTLVDEHYESPNDIEVRGNVSGVSSWDLAPMNGVFKYAPVAEEGVYRVRVPRQVDASLELVMLEMPGQAGHDSEEILDQVGYDGGRAGHDGVRTEDDGERAVVNRLPLGEYIIRSGYDWAAKDLSDVSVALDLEKQQVMVTVSGWDEIVVMDVVI